MQAAETRGDLRIKCKKIRKALKLLREHGPTYPGLNTHSMNVFRGPGGETIWNSYVENGTPNAWRIFWLYGGPDEIFVLSVGPHDHTPGGESG